MKGTYALPGINPEPWTSPAVSVGRRGGRLVPQVFKSAALSAYQESVRDALMAAYPEVRPVSGPVGLEFFFWRQLVNYEGETRRNRKNRVDATNLQKACEDALQGVLITNDRDVLHVSSWVVEQAVDTEPLIVIRLNTRPKVPLWTEEARELYSPIEPEPVPSTTDFDVEEIF